MSRNRYGDDLDVTDSKMVVAGFHAVAVAGVRAVAMTGVRDDCGMLAVAESETKRRGISI